jgi:hypothetical protein
VPAALTFALLAAGAAAAQDGARPGEVPAIAHRAGFQTGALDFPPAGHLVLSLGFEYLPDVRNELAGVRGELARIPAMGLALGLSERASFRVSWPMYNRLRVHHQDDPAPLGRRLGGVSTDWGDVTVATLIEFQPANGGWPGYGLRFAAKLPNTNEKLGIGDNTTDVFASVLLANRPAPRLSLFADLGLGILAERTASFTQNDVFTYAALAEWRATGRVRLIGELTGRASTHAAGPGTGSRAELRAGAELGRGSLRGAALLIGGVSGRESRGVGVAVHVSTQIAALPRR